MIRDLINAIAEGNTLAIDDSFNAVMASKIADRLDDMRVYAAQNMFGSVVEESVELDEEETPTGIKIYHTDKAGKSGSQIVFTHQDAARAHKEIKKEGGKVTHHALMFGKTEGEKRVVSESVELDEEFDFLEEAVGTARTDRIELAAARKRIAARDAAEAAAKNDRSRDTQDIRVQHHHEGGVFTSLIRGRSQEDIKNQANDIEKVARAKGDIKGKVHRVQISGLTGQDPNLPRLNRQADQNHAKKFPDKVNHYKSLSESLEEAVGTAAKYAGKTGVMGGKYKSTDKALELTGDKFNAWRAKQSAKRSAEHKGQDPKLAAAGYGKHMVDIEKAKKNAAARGVDSSHLNWKHRNGVTNRKLPEEFYLEDYSIEELEDFMMSEDFEQLDELSKKTLGSYVKKASLDNADRGINYGYNSSGNQKSLSKMVKRSKNIDKAVDKITKESVDLDEERGDMGVERSPNGSCRGSSQHSMDLAKQSGYTHAVMHSGTKGGIDTYHTTKAGAEKRLAAVRKKHGIPEYSTRARIAEL